MDSDQRNKDLNLKKRRNAWFRCMRRVFLDPLKKFFRKVYVTHGQSDVLARYLREVEGVDAEPLETLFEGESD